MGFFAKLTGRAASTDATAKRWRVLVVDPGVTVPKVIELVLQHAVVTRAGSLAETKASLSANRPDLVIGVPSYSDGDGYQLCAMVTTDPFHSCPVILLTVPFQEFDNERARAAGAAEILQAPFQPNDLLAAVDRVLGPQTT